MTAEAQNAALLAHIASQMQLNIAFLESQNYISSNDATTMKSIMAQLPITTQAVAETFTRTTTLPNNIVTPARTVAPPPTRQIQVVKARALWAYNEDGSEPNDLSFSAGEIIEIISEQNQDWWLGRARGKEALFPSNHVEKVDATAALPVTPPQVDSPGLVKVAGRPYKPFGAALHGTNVPPPAGEGVNSVGLQQAAGQAEQKSKYGKYGNTLAHSAAGGVGFGAGAAIGGGLVRAIF